MTGIELMAKAAYEKFNDGLIGSLEPSWNDCPGDLKHRIISAQRAALMALREYPPVFGNINKRKGSISRMYEDDKADWGALIDCFLKERA